MKKILTLLKLEFKAKFGNVSVKNTKSWMKAVLSIAFYALLVYLVFWGAQVIFRMFNTAGMGFEALVLLFVLLFILLLSADISSTIKVLYYKGDNVILMRFPVNGAEIFISKTLFLIINQIIITATILVPFLLAYASVIPVKPFFYWMIPLAVFFMFMIPFLLSNILAIPVMHLTNKIRNKFTVIIAVLTMLIVGFFAAYMFIFSRIIDFLKDSNFSVFSDEIVMVIKEVVYYIVPLKYFAHLLLFRQLYIALPVLILITAALLSGMILVIAKLYQKTLLKSVEVEGSAFTHKTKNKRKSVFMTLFKKEFIQVFRSVNYSFQYFVLAAAMPLMVYFCNSITVKVGQNTIGEQVSIGITILVMLVFATVITSFSATSITREGNNFFHTKIIPVSFQKQLFVKFIMYLVVSFTANLICILILAFSGLMSVKLSLWVFAIVQSLSIGMTLRSMRYDIRKPYFNIVGEGEVVNNNPNTTQSIFFGFLISAAIGILSMLSAYLLTENYMITVCSIAAALVVIYCVAVYFINLKSAYGKIVR